MNRLDESLKGGHALHSNLLHANLITIVYNGYRDLVILHLFPVHILLNTRAH